MFASPRNFFIALWLVAACCLLQGQGTNGVILGTARDATGAVISGAKVTVRNEATNVARSVLSNTAGDYSVPLLPPGSYQVTVEQAGFRNAIYGPIGLSVNQTIRVDASLTVGSQTERVEVTEANTLIQTDTSSIGAVVNQRNISTLPLNERNFVSFAYLVPGVQLPAQGSLDSTQGLALSVNGARETANNFLIDGIDDNDLVINQYSAVPTLDAVQEFKVQSGNYTAEFGRSGGAQINLLLKSGTNDIHGTAYEFLRNRHLDAKNYFDQPDCGPASVPGTCSSIPRLDRSQFGASVGGPIVKDKTFFFAAFEYLNLRDAVTREATVPSQQNKAQALASVPASRVNQAGLNILNLYPAANVGTNPLTSTTFVSAPIGQQTEPYGVVKIDHHPSEKNTISGHYVISFGNTINPFDPLAPFTNLPGYGTTVLTHGQNGGVSWTHIFNPRTVNEFRLGANKELGFFYQTDNKDYSKSLGFPNVLTSPTDLGYPNVSVAGFDGIGQPTNVPQDHPTYTAHLSDNLAWNPTFDGGRHQFRFGFEMRYYIYFIQFDVLARGLWTFNGGNPGNSLNPAQNSLTQLLLGTPDVAQTTSAGADVEMIAPSYDGFIQDDYRLNPHLTLNLGLRYEFNLPVTESTNKLSSPDLSARSQTCSPQPDCQFIPAGTNGLPRATYNPDYKNFAPRIGLAWRPTNSDRLVIRSAYGIFTDQVILNANLDAAFNPPFTTQKEIQNPSGNLTIQNILYQPAASSPATATYLARNLRDAYMQHWNIDLQGQITKDLLLDVGYVGTRGIHLINLRNINQPLPGQSLPYPQFAPSVSITDNSGDSWYNALQARLEKHSTKSGTFLAAYTFSRCLDTGSSLFGSAANSTAQYGGDIRAERGLCDFNANHRFVGSYVYELPIGTGHSFLGHGVPGKVLEHWQVSGIFTWQTGQPFTVTRGVPQSGTLPTGGSDRPDIVGNPFQAGPVAANPGCTAPTSVQNPNTWFNPCAFLAAPGRFGDLGRDTLIGPGFTNLDFSILKDIQFTEHQRLQLRGEFFNIFNHPHFDLPNANFDSSGFGQLLTSNAYGSRPPRQIQIGLKFLF